jgi:tRNA(Arg) A34 adenosine deaminase TadA
MNRINQMLTRLAISSGGFESSRRVPMAAGITYKKHLISTGVNRRKTHPMMLGEGYRTDQLFMHAEVDAIRNALRLITPEQLKQCDLHIVRVKRPHIASNRWVYGLAKPCAGCSNIIKSYGIKRVFWSEDESKILDFVA